MLQGKRLTSQLFGCILSLGEEKGRGSQVACYYYVTDSSRSPVRDFIDSLDASSQRKFFFVRSLLEKFGHRLPQPHAKYVGDEIFELRFKGQEGYLRVLYFFFHRDKAIFTNGFIKKTARLPNKEKALALERRKAFLRQQKD